MIGNILIELGANIIAYDPKAMANTQKLYPAYNFADDPYSACKNADGVIICTEWNEFRALNIVKLKNIVKRTIMFDLRNLYNRTEMENSGWEHVSVGR